MRRSAFSLFSHLSRQRLNISAPLLSRNHIFSSSSKIHGFFFKNSQFQASSSRNMATFAERLAQMDEMQRKYDEERKTEEAIAKNVRFARTSEEVLKAFKAMESAFSTKTEGVMGLLYKRKLAEAALHVGIRLDVEGEDPEKVLSYASRALKDLEIYDRYYPDMSLTMALYLMGAVNYKLERFSDSLEYFDRARRIIDRFKEEGFYVDDLGPISHILQRELARVKIALGRAEEAVEHLRKYWELWEMTLDKDDIEYSKANQDLAELYVDLSNFKDALGFCVRALEMHKQQFGENSEAVAHDRRLLATIYRGLGEHEKALEQDLSLRKVLKNLGLSSYLLRAEIDAASILIALGKYDEAIDTLKGVAQQTDKDSVNSVLVFSLMGKALCKQEKYADAKKCLDSACGILYKKEKLSPEDFVRPYLDIAMLFMTMNEFEAALSLLKRALPLLEKHPQEKQHEGSVSARIGWLQIELGKYDEAIGTLKGVAQKMDEESDSIIFVFSLMGKALCNQEKFADAKKCLDSACGILYKKERVSPEDVAMQYLDISMQLETMNEFEAAISLLKRTLPLLEKHPQGKQYEGSVTGRIGWLLLVTGKFSQAVPYLESAAEMWKDSFGPKHFCVGYIYNNLGAAYLELDRPLSAQQMFAAAKDILDASLGPHNADSIESCQNLSKAYGAMGSCARAIEFQQQVVDAWESQGPSVELIEAQRLLEEFEEKASGTFSSNELTTKATPLPRFHTSARSSFWSSICRELRNQLPKF